MAMLSARAATPSGLSRFASSCQHRIAIAWRAMFPIPCQHEWEDGWAFANCVHLVIGPGSTASQRPVSWQIMQMCTRCSDMKRRQLTDAEWETWSEDLLSGFRHGLGHEWIEDLPIVAASGIETEGQDGATRLGAKHESPTEGDAQ